MLSIGQLHRAIGPADLIDPAPQKLCGRCSEVRFIMVLQGARRVSLSTLLHDETPLALMQQCAVNLLNLARVSGLV
jgi:hypothetical protein